AEDAARKEEADVRNQADSLIYQTDKLLKEQGEKVTGPEKDALESSLGRLKSASEGTDLEAIKTAVEEVSTASQAFAQKLYETTATDNAGQYDAGAAAGAGATGADDDDVVDAEVIDEDGES
ncbi:MAG: Hsp70 family protein, partial [Acidimicrobiales bacterium]|nr:Hsp70 family protein [Acidimicrobiales bacterium]